MKLALIIWSLEAGGAERVMWRLANAWSAAHDVTLVTLSGSIADHYMLEESVQRRRLTLALPSVRPLRTIRNNAVSVSRIRRAIQQIDPDLVVSFMDRTNNQVLVSLVGLGIPAVISERVDPRVHSIPPKARVLRRLVYPTARALVVQTRSVERWAHRFMPADRVHVIPNPVSNPTHEDSSRERVIVGMGRLVDQKGFDLLIRAFASAHESLPGWKLRIFGEGEGRNSLERIVGDLGLDDLVELPGLTADPYRELSTAGIFVLSSRYEGFPNVLLEAMTCGTASIATDCPSGPAEIVRQGETGILVPPNDIDALATAMRQLVDDPTLRQELGQNAALDVNARYSLDRVLGMWDEVLQSTLGSSFARGVD